MKYPFKLYQARVEDHVFWVAESFLKGCVAQGDDMESALRELEGNEAAWLDTAKECGLEIPPVPVEKMTLCSGKFTVRVAPYVHQDAVNIAQKQGISLNQYVNNAIIEQNARMMAMDRSNKTEFYEIENAGYEAFL